MSIDPWDALRYEIARGRRHGRNFTLMSVPIASTVAPSRRRRRAPASETLQRVSKLIRSTDLVWERGRDLLLLLPETGAPGGHLMLTRMDHSMPGLLATRDARLAVFPTDGLTTGALLDALEPAPRRAPETSTTTILIADAEESGTASAGEAMVA